MVHPRRKQNPNVKLHRTKRKNNEDYTRLVAPQLTLMGKITVIKSLLASQLVYILSPLPSNNHYIKMIQNDLFTFLWNGKKGKIKRSEMINDYEDGGLKMLNLKSFSRSLKFTWIQKYLNDESHEKWKVFIDYYLKQLGEKLAT